MLHPIRSLTASAVGRFDAEPTTSVTIAICSNRPALAARAGRAARRACEPSDRVLVVLDADRDGLREFADAVLGQDIELVEDERDRGLSNSRNRAIEACRNDYIVFIDDDVTIDAPALAEIRAAFGSGSDIVGVRIELSSECAELPWFISPGQLHYLGVHGAETSTATWGACMGVAMRPLRNSGVRFRSDLGRRDGTLLSAEDTTFLAELRARGARETFLADTCVQHDVLQDRQRLSQMIRRAYWQGRSERTRGQSLRGMYKEVRRNFSSGVWPPRRLLLATLYTNCVLVGIVTEGARRMLGRNA